MSLAAFTCCVSAAQSGFTAHLRARGGAGGWKAARTQAGPEMRLPGEKGSWCSSLPFRGVAEPSRVHIHAMGKPKPREASVAAVAAGVAEQKRAGSRTGNPSDYNEAAW